ncbi:hypothetical protein F441_11859 [Phytophthora nicotianae CJ01A1]|uniref:Transmembrane protein 223 n=8 Tax=Phytophthora nicotianae TaxID=4792 RepID=W2Q177_PHYN3|nr:hypothetical protein PPTG_12715 [Phytophthora nicotianae INRA-310]ETI43075.1 hypothetical protein F443_11900 [Phytophthora nicotianae P1569]ETK83118.1 hypothetical protein L915_11611 [Phytophthora nicotianae]ETP12821.1 hypothetical protein F441_11859 [Phytophthora nicotianae CJ01A1]ETL36497.1 hypothetical protein L916_11531 [Phytophthora nicotianae]ETL89717.1 hypothetical protein L917_11394 [Phytophthora nicotianae]
MLLTVLRRPSVQLSLLARGSRNDTAQVLRFFSSTSSSAPPEQKAKKNDDEEELTNTKLWDNVLANHPEHAEQQGGDLLYEYPQKSYFGYMSAGSLAHIAFWSWLKGYEQSLVEMHPVLGEPTFFSFISDDFGSSMGFGMSILLAGLIGFHASRSVARISVVAGGDKLRFTTHKFFGDFANPIDVPISYVSANPNTKNNIILKLANRRGFYLVDTKGKFYNREKLERMITFRTNFSEHKKMMEKKTTIEVRTDLPRVDLKAEAAQAEANRKLPSRARSKARHGNLLGKKNSSKKGGKKK